MKKKWSFITAIVDDKFNHLLSADLVRSIYRIVIVLSFLGLLVSLGIGVKSLIKDLSSGTNYNWYDVSEIYSRITLDTLKYFLISPLAFIINIVFYRVICELVFIPFKVIELLTELKEGLKPKSD